MCIGIAIVGVVLESGAIQFHGKEGNSSHDTILSEYVPVELHNRSFKIEYLFPNQIRLDAPDEECRKQAVDFGIADIQFGVAVLKLEIFGTIWDWLRLHPLKHDLKTMHAANLRGANLIGANLRGADLRGADLRGANLRGADLRGANLRGANLIGANLIDADLIGANLRGANLRGADLIDADLRGADLIDADLRGADLIDADLRGADLIDADRDYAKSRGAIVDLPQNQSDGGAAKTP